MFKTDTVEVTFAYGTLKGTQVNSHLAKREPIVLANGKELKRRVPPEFKNNEFRVTDCVVYRLEEGERDQASLTGMAFCSPVDNFDRDRGRKLALARALRGLPKRARKPVWDAYLAERRAIERARALRWLATKGQVVAKDSDGNVVFEGGPKDAS
ncbi:MAG: hypothetical protein ACWGQW_03380 [bacterium]